MKYTGLFFGCMFILAQSFFGCKAADSPARGQLPTAADTIEIAFYNLENLFDTIDNPNKRDEDFLPDSDRRWNTERYHKKLSNISRVIAAMDVPELMGLCEVENARVVEDLIARPKLKKYNFGYVHFESPDVRGIDNALIFQKAHFHLKGSQIIRLDFPPDIADDYTSRDILIVEGNLHGQPLFVIVNHWPSRRGGLRKSESKRLFVARQLKSRLEELRTQYPDHAFILMGDFNDEPNNKSISEVLQARPPTASIDQSELYNLFYKKQTAGLGSYNYRGNWNMLDQIIISGDLLRPDNEIFMARPVIFRKDWMLYNDERYGPTPNRTYGGPNYYGGYSDHLPVMVKTKVN